MRGSKVRAIRTFDRWLLRVAVAKQCANARPEDPMQVEALYFKERGN